MTRRTRVIGLLVLLVCGLALWSTVPFGLHTATAATVRQSSPVRPDSSGHFRQFCDDNGPLCTETLDPNSYEGKYRGHDEPSILYYSNVSGAGNSNIYRVRLPKDPPALPKQDGSGGTDNFMLHPAFWFGMAMCDTQSAPNPGAACTADSDTNIFDSADPNAADYIGNHPGAGFMEMQFYPPGWTNGCDAKMWCAALNIDSLSTNMNTGALNNATCLDQVGEEYVNFAFITHNGVAQAPANPVDSTNATYTPDPKLDLFMKPGDVLLVDMHDTADGFTVIIKDLTSHKSGSMTASIANNFGQVKFDPSGTGCTNIPYAFHPMYATSSEHTRVPWTAHSYNVSFSDEIGHFEYCAAADSQGNCTSAGASDPGGLDADDVGCSNAADSPRYKITGCTGTDVDFDGVPYQLTWPGTLTKVALDKKLHAQSILFTSPLFNGNTNYDRIGFETDLPRIEGSTTPPCDRNTGANCVNPPQGANFYPFFSTAKKLMSGSCVWQLGGANIPGTKDTFGGSSTAEYGSLLQLTYPTVGGTVQRYNDFRQVLSANPCNAKAKK